MHLSKMNKKLYNLSICKVEVYSALSISSLGKSHKSSRVKHTFFPFNP